MFTGEVRGRSFLHLAQLLDAVIQNSQAKKNIGWIPQTGNDGDKLALCRAEWLDYLRPPSTHSTLAIQNDVTYRLSDQFKLVTISVCRVS